MKGQTEQQGVPWAGKAESLLLQCPACGELVMLEAPEASRRRVGCLHCGEEAWLDLENSDNGPDPWELVADWPDDRD